MLIREIHMRNSKVRLPNTSSSETTEKSGAIIQVNRKIWTNFNFNPKGAKNAEKSSYLLAKRLKFI